MDCLLGAVADAVGVPPKLSRYRRRVLAARPVVTLSEIFQTGLIPVKAQALLRRLGEMGLEREQRRRLDRPSSG